MTDDEPMSVREWMMRNGPTRADAQKHEDARTRLRLAREKMRQSAMMQNQHADDAIKKAYDYYLARDPGAASQIFQGQGQTSAQPITCKICGQGFMGCTCAQPDFAGTSGQWQIWTSSGTGSQTVTVRDVPLPSRERTKEDKLRDARKNARKRFEADNSPWLRFR